MDTQIDEETIAPPEPISVCKCLLNTEPSEELNVLTDRKKFIFSTVARTENYLRERRIPELIRFMLAKIISEPTKNPCEYGVKLLDACMVFRAGHGPAPVIYEKRHLDAVVKSFDPGNRGWLSAGQVRRAFATLGLPLDEDLEEKISTDVVLEKLRTVQENELLSLLQAGTSKELMEAELKANKKP